MSLKIQTLPVRYVPRRAVYLPITAPKRIGWLRRWLTPKGGMIKARKP
jgi:hypothetical protein